VNRNYGLVPYVSGPSFGVSPLFGFPLIGHYGPGTFGHSYNGTINGGFGGFSAGKGGINVTLGGGRQRVTSRSETTIMPNTSVSTTFGFPGGNSSLSPFVRPNVGAQRGGLGMGRLR
jgi:hypothetical protein